MDRKYIDVKNADKMKQKGHVSERWIGKSAVLQWTLVVQQCSAMAILGQCAGGEAKRAMSTIFFLSCVCLDICFTSNKPYPQCPSVMCMLGYLLYF